MFDWLYEGNPAVYVLLGGVAGLLLYFWWRTRKRKWLYGTAGVIALIGVYFLLGRYVETDQKQIQRRVEAMVAAIQAHNVDAVFEHVSDEFRGPRNLSKREFRDAAAREINRIETIAVWDIKFPEEISRTKGTVPVFFSVAPHGSSLGKAGEVSYRVEAIYDFDPQKGWQLKSFRLFFVGSRDELSLPI